MLLILFGSERFHPAALEVGNLDGLPALLGVPAIEQIGVEEAV